MDEKELKRLVESLNNKKKKVVKRITPLVGHEIAILLASIPHSVSPPELGMIAKILNSFESLRVHHYSKIPYTIALEGRTSDGNLVIFNPQYKIIQPIGKNGRRNPPWSVDLMVRLFAKINGREICIAALGYEYDGHDAHYVERGVKSGYIRDWNILQEEDISIIRISPAAWESSSDGYVSGLKRFFRKKIDHLKDIQMETVKSLFGNTDNFEISIDDEIIVTCNVCTGKGKLASMECEACNGMGSLPKSKLKKFDLSSYDKIPCPECRFSIDCRACQGSGFTSREALLNFAR